jgi:hypothetical protein
MSQKSLPKTEELQPQSGEQRQANIPPYPDNIIGERQVVRNWQIESGDNRLTHED